MHQTAHIPVIVVAGATGTGKSAVALHLAREFDGTIINADSRQVYADFPIITAQPSATDTSLTPHELYGFLPTTEKLSAGAYAALAAQAIHRVRAAGKTPILVGGTGLYLRTLFQGIAPIPPIPEHVSAAWQTRCRSEGANALHALLVERDPETATRLHPNDSQRITRALEVLEVTGKTLGYWHALSVQKPLYAMRGIVTNMPLDSIAPRLAARIDAMLEDGALAEAEAALERCPIPEAPGWSGIGCAELYRHICGDIDLATCKALWLANTRAYAKRQLTWFRKATDFVPFAPSDTQGIFAFCSPAASKTL